VFGNPAASTVLAGLEEGLNGVVCEEPGVMAEIAEGIGGSSALVLKLEVMLRFAAREV
jgi:hypothetical protein